MDRELPIVYLARHGETAWSITGQHTGLTDLPLTEKGERNAARLGDRLHGLSVAKVYTSPLQRARRTCELAGESPLPVGARADRVVSRLRAVPGNVLVFSSGHFLRVLAARWLGLEASAPGRYFLLTTASLSAVGYEHNVSRPVIRLWNDDRHVEA